MNKIIQTIKDALASIGGSLKVGDYTMTTDNVICTKNGNTMNYENLSPMTLVRIIEVLTYETITRQ